MDKKLIFFFLLSAALGASTLAQSPVRINGTDYHSDTSAFVSPQGSPAQGKKINDNNWFNFIEASDASNGGTINYINSTNRTLFPDSTVKISMDTGKGGSALGYASLHNIGQMFDPKSNCFPEPLNEYTPYSIDSIAISYRYTQGIPGSTDTLRFQAFKDQAIRSGNLLGTGILAFTAWIEYDRQTEKGENATQEWNVILNASDTSSGSDFRIKKIALPSSLYVQAGKLFAVAYQFIPGYSYRIGDTLELKWNPEPTKKLNQFQALIALDTFPEREIPYNHDLTMGSYNKYDPNSGWAEAFIPGNVWDKYIEQAYISFHLISHVGLNPLLQNQNKVYPNPSTENQNMTISFTLSTAAKVDIEVFDLLGNKVITIMNQHLDAGEHEGIVQVSELNAGIYVYRIKAGEQSVSGKLSIIK